MKPLISIIIPSYNIQEYIGRCLDSVISQTYKNLEIIVVNDGSTDNTGTILDQYAKQDKRIVVFHCQNGGVSKARNLAIEVAKGEFIGFVDGDDTIEPDMYESLLKGILDYNADISCCGYKKIYSGKIKKHYDVKKITTLNNIQGVKNYLNARLTDGILCSKLYRAKLFNNIRLNENIKFIEDFQVNYYLFLKASKSVYIGGLKYNYIVRENSACTANANIQIMKNTYQVAHEILCSINPNNEIYPAAFNSYIRYLCTISLLGLKSNALDNECVEFLKDIETKLKENIICTIKTIQIKPMYKIHAIGVVYFRSFYSWLYKRIIYNAPFYREK